MRVKFASLIPSVSILFSPPTKKHNKFPPFFSLSSLLSSHTGTVLGPFSPAPVFFTMCGSNMEGGLFVFKKKKNSDKKEEEEIEGAAVGGSGSMFYEGR